MGKNANQTGWKIEDGGLRWGASKCALVGDKGHLVFGECKTGTDEKEDAGDGFLARKFFGNPKHRFVIFDSQSMSVAKSDADIPKGEQEHKD